VWISVGNMRVYIHIVCNIDYVQVATGRAFGMGDLEQTW
jgi:hypothetical protein